MVVTRNNWQFLNLIKFELLLKPLTFDKIFEFKRLKQCIVNFQPQLIKFSFIELAFIIFLIFFNRSWYIKNVNQIAA